MYYTWVKSVESAQSRPPVPRAQPSDIESNRAKDVELEETTVIWEADEEEKQSYNLYCQDRNGNANQANPIIILLQKVKQFEREWWMLIVFGVINEVLQILDSFWGVGWLGRELNASRDMTISKTTVLRPDWKHESA